MNDNPFHTMLSQLDAGTSAAKNDAALKDVIAGICRNPGKDKKGKLTIELTFTKNPTSDRIDVEHKTTSVKPTMRGKTTEIDSGSTAMYAGNNGAIDISPESQEEIPFTTNNVEPIKNEQ